MQQNELSRRTLLDARAAARRLRVPRSWLVAETLAGRLPGLRAGDTFLYEWSSLEAALLARAARTGATVERTGGEP